VVITPPSLALPDEVFSMIVENLYSIVDACHWYNCQKSTSRKWHIEHIKSLLLLLYERNKYMFPITKKACYIKNAYMVDYVDKMIEIVQNIIKKSPTFEFFLQETATITHRFQEPKISLRDYFKPIEGTIKTGTKSKEKITTPLNHRQKAIFSMVCSYIRGNHGLILMVNDSNDVWHLTTKEDVFDSVRLESEIYFNIE